MLIGHQKQLNYLKRMAESGKIPHALLFSGQKKLGKKTIALEFISWLFEEPGVPKILGHPDFILIEPQEKHPEAERSSLRGSPAPSSALVRGQIQINQIRDLSWRLSLKPIKAQLKAVIIDEAHSMTPEAQNCFLKTLEEPKGNTLLILITEKPNFLLPTIVSRCQIIKFYPVKKDEIERYLKNQEGLSKREGDELCSSSRTTPLGGVRKNFSSSDFANARVIEEILEIAQGRPGRAVELAFAKEKFEFYKKRTRELAKIFNSNLSSRFQYAKEISTEENLQEILEIWLNYFRNIFIKNCSTSRATAKAKRTSFSSLPSSRKQDSVGEEEDSSSSPCHVEHLKSILQQLQRTI